MNFNYRYIIWDWNGTLINDSWLCVEIINELLSKRGIQKISMQRYQEVFGFPVKDFYEKIGFDFSKEPFYIPATEYHNEYYRRRFQCNLQDGVTEALSFFQGAGLTQSILSASKKSALEEALDRYSLTSYFNSVSGLNDHYAESKVEIAKELFDQIGLPNNEIVIIGDTTHDYEVATALKIDCILFCGGHHRRDKLESCGVPVLDSFTEIMNPAKFMAQH